jgi:hypothetical protein
MAAKKKTTGKKAGKTKTMTTATNVTDDVRQKAFDLRKQGATYAIICHTLNLPYGTAKTLGKEYDGKVGHEPQVIMRNADALGKARANGKSATSTPKKTATAKPAAIDAK